MAERDTSKQPMPELENSTTMVYVGTRSRSGAACPVNYRALVQGQEKLKEHSAIVESQSSSSSAEREVHFFMATRPEEVAEQLARQAQARQEQSEQLQAHS